jgi:SAM-dependent methyltransferase
MKDDIVLACPRCRAPIARAEKGELRCTADQCDFAQTPFPCVIGQPVLIDFAKSIFRPHAYQSGSGSVFGRDDSGESLAVRLRDFIWAGHNRIAPRVARELIRRFKGRRPPAKLLVVGGGAINPGVRELYSGVFDVVGMDVYASAHTRFVADAHSIPLQDESVDIVWIQAVLEHVLDPNDVVKEIHRVLRPGGLVYADTPFLQQVHEGAYDFTRYTLSGHRWLFKQFDEIETGAVSGAGTALVQAIRYAARSVVRNDKVATLITIPFFWIRFLDYATNKRQNADAASGVYFFGKKGASALLPHDMLEFYTAQARSQRKSGVRFQTKELAIARAIIGAIKRFPPTLIQFLQA